MTPRGRHRPSEPAAGDGTDLDDLALGLLGSPLTMARRDVATEAGVSQMSARRFWHALGFPRAGSDDEVFGQADLYALRQAVRLVRDGILEEDTALAMTRALARSTDRLAIWQAQLIAESLEPHFVPDAEPSAGEEGPEHGSRAIPDAATARAAALVIVALADELEPLVVYAWRRHLMDAVTRMIADAAPGPDSGADPSSVHRCIGFADLVNFTALVRRLSERQLATVVQRFEALASDIITAHGGRVIKTVGDEVLFVTTRPGPAAAIALDLVDAMGEDDVLPEVRVGMASGPVVSRLGDVFGITVNRASRLTAVANPSSVLIDSALAHGLTSVSGFSTRRLRKRTLRGVGPVTPSVLTRIPSLSRRVPSVPSVAVDPELAAVTSLDGDPARTSKPALAAFAALSEGPSTSTTSATESP